MNDSDTDANTKAIDSLLNYETVKYFGANERARRALRQVDGALRERSVKTWTSLGDAELRARR
jgi:ABC-type transport system involved in Fe-S cluster assembly fused permease/ATPase subunit